MWQRWMLSPVLDNVSQVQINENVQLVLKSTATCWTLKYRAVIRLFHFQAKSPKWYEGILDVYGVGYASHDAVKRCERTHMRLYMLKKKVVHQHITQPDEATHRSYRFTTWKKVDRQQSHNQMWQNSHEVVQIYNMKKGCPSTITTRCGRTHMRSYRFTTWKRVVRQQSKPDVAKLTWSRTG